MIRSVFLSLLLVNLAYCQISVPTEVEPFKPIVAQCKVPGADEKAEVQILWEARTDFEFISTNGGSTLHIWAPPGTHTLKANIFVIDWENRKFDVKQLATQFTVTGNVPIDPDEPDDPPGPLASLLPEGVNRYALAAFYRDFGAVVRNSEQLKSTGQFRAAQQLAVKTLKQSAGLPDAPQVNDPISQRLSQAIGLDDVSLTPDMREKLASTLEDIGRDF